MSLRQANLVLLAAVLGACAWLWQRDLAARDSLGAAGRDLAAARGEAEEACRAARRAAEDLEELRGALARSQARAEEMAEARASDIRAAGAREARWTEAATQWKAAVEARDRRLAELGAREAELRARLEEAARRLEEAVRRLERAERPAG